MKNKNSYQTWQTLHHGELQKIHTSLSTTVGNGFSDDGYMIWLGTNCTKHCTGTKNKESKKK